MGQYLYVLDCTGEEFNVWPGKYTHISDLRLNWRPLEWGSGDVSHDDKVKEVKVHPCTGTEALYRPYGP